MASLAGMQLAYLRDPPTPASGAYFNFAEQQLTCVNEVQLQSDARWAKTVQLVDSVAISVLILRDYNWCPGWLLSHLLLTLTAPSQ